MVRPAYSGFQPSATEMKSLESDSTLEVSQTEREATERLR